MNLRRRFFLPYDTEAAVSLRLAELLLQQSKVTEAKEVLAPLSSGRWRNDFWNDEELQRILEACAEFEGVPVSVLDLLHQLALECGDTNASKKYLLRLMSHLPFVLISF